MVQPKIIDDEGKLTRRGLKNMGERIEFVIKKIFGMTIHEFAKHSDIPPSTLYGWCNGSRPKNKEAFIHLINNYHINKNWLFYEKGSIFDKRGKPNFKKQWRK